MGRPGEGPGPDEIGALPSRVDADVRRVLDLLEAWGVRATFFVLGEVARAHPETILSIAAAGHEIACHGFRHVPVDTLSREEFARDLDAAIAAIVAASGHRPRGYRAPIWSLPWSPWGLETLVTRGFAYDSSFAPVPPLGPPGLPFRPTLQRTGAGSILELPPLTKSLGPVRFPVGFALGLRLLPVAFIARRIAAENEAGFPALVAFHPWELDPDPPALRLPSGLAFAHSFGTEKLLPRLGRLVREAPFGTAGEALGVMRENLESPGGIGTGEASAGCSPRSQNDTGRPGDGPRWPGDNPYRRGDDPSRPKNDTGRPGGVRAGV